MKPLSVAFLWHMHQPIYKDAVTGVYLLPWVRLHALKGYTDLAALAEKYPEFRQTINFTPSLLVQLAEYLENPGIKDHFLEITRKSADSLTREDKQFILKNFYMNNLERVIHVHPRYSELFHKRGDRFILADFPSYLKRFSTQDFLDLQVLFNLCWFGFSAQKLYPRVRALLEKVRGYTEEDKREVIDLQWQVMKDVVPRLKKLMRDGKIEITASPFYHPILPLLSKQNERDPGFSWQDDAHWQVENAVTAFERIFGAKPKGMWPSEGSVSEGAVSVMAQSGLAWIATDEDILFHSIAGKNRDEELYQPWEFKTPSGPIKIFFRDRTLSDLIGFGYHRGSAKDGVEDLLRRLSEIRKRTQQVTDRPIASIILDGENPWEFYSQSGEEFLNLLFEKLSHESHLKTVTFSEYSDQNPASKSLEHLYSGSWINHNFDIWFRHAEDLMAWDYLYETRRAVVRFQSELPPDRVREIWNEIYMAEASDWYWWFGEEFYTETGDTFDYLFRSHLIHAWALMNKKLPARFKTPIKKFASTKAQGAPFGLVLPVIDGRTTHYFEWVNAGFYHNESWGGAMIEASRIIDSIYYGFSLTDLFIRLDLSCKVSKELTQKSLVMIHFHDKQDFEVEFSLNAPRSFDLYRIQDSSRIKMSTIVEGIASDQVIELAIPFSLLECARGEPLRFSVAIHEGEKKLDECPRYGLIEFLVPDKDYETNVWTV